MGWKSVFLVALLIAGAIGYYLLRNVEQAPPEATLPGYTKSLQNDEQKAKDAVSIDRTKDVQAAVERYKSDKGANPASLQDLVPQYLDHIPGGVQYDSATGTVSAAP